jgi:hypothetical protein
VDNECEEAGDPQKAYRRGGGVGGEEYKGESLATLNEN